MTDYNKSVSLNIKKIFLFIEKLFKLFYVYKNFVHINQQASSLFEKQSKTKIKLEIKNIFIVNKLLNEMKYILSKVLYYFERNAKFES